MSTGLAHQLIPSASLYLADLGPKSTISSMFFFPAEGCGNIKGNTRMMQDCIPKIT